MSVFPKMQTDWQETNKIKSFLISNEKFPCCKYKSEIGWDNSAFLTWVMLDFCLKIIFVSHHHKCTLLHQTESVNLINTVYLVLFNHVRNVTKFLLYYMRKSTNISNPNLLSIRHRGIPISIDSLYLYLMTSQSGLKMLYLSKCNTEEILKAADSSDASPFGNNSLQ